MRIPRIIFTIAAVVAGGFGLWLLEAQTAVTLSPVPSPTTGQPAVTPIILTGSGFPTGTIQPTDVTVLLSRPPAVLRARPTPLR